MVENHLDMTFHALADPTRRGMLATLALGEKSIGELAEPFAMSFAGASKPVKVLEEAGLVRRGRDAQRRPCRLDPAALGEATAWIERTRQIWEGNYERLDAVLAAMKEAVPPAPQTDPAKE